MILKNKSTTTKDFEYIKEIISKKYELEKNNIEAIFIKELPEADLIFSNKTNSKGKTSHIACTGNSRNFFYPIIGDITANQGFSNNSTFDIYVDTTYLDNKDSKFIKTKCTIWICKKSEGENQIGLSKQEYDGKYFFELRKKMHKDDILIFFKYLEKDNNLNNYAILLKKDEEIYKDLMNKIDTLKKRPKYYEEINNEITINSEIEKNNPILKGINKIYFGAPGTGKSKYVNDTYYNEFATRVTFHSEYTYNDFIGYIKPFIKNDGCLTYEFVPGPFTEILKKSLKDPNNMYSLIIEELNRANTSAVFGDIFQLLDRDSTGKSEYMVNNNEIYNYIKNELKESYKFNDGSIYIPNNLNIIATMNIADQNVFVIDTAFKRRWEFEHLQIKFDDKHPFKNKIINNLNIDWESFVNIINKFMMSYENSDLMISEDKQIGPFFIKEDELNDCKKFAYKVLLYLWEDVFKMDRERIFNNEIRTFSDLINRFSTDKSLDIFVSEINEQFKTNISYKKDINKEDNIDA